MHVNINGAISTYAFRLTVDQFAALTITNISALISNATYASVEIQYQNTVSNTS